MSFSFVMVLGMFKMVEDRQEHGDAMVRARPVITIRLIREVRVHFLDHCSF